MSTYITASACQEATPKTPTPDSPPDRGKIRRPARGAGILPPRRFGIWFALAAAVLGFAVPSEAGVRTGFYDVTPKSRQSPAIRIGQMMTFRARLMGNGNPVPNALIKIYIDGSPVPNLVTRSGRDGWFTVQMVITEALLRSPIPPRGRKVMWQAEFGGTRDYLQTGKQGAGHDWGFWLMP